MTLFRIKIELLFGTIRHIKTIVKPLFSMSGFRVISEMPNCIEFDYLFQKKQMAVIVPLY